MTRDELIEAATDAAQNIPNPIRLLFDEDDEAQVSAVVDAVEPMIRADEREKVATEVEAIVRAKDERIYRQAWADLHAQVEALPAVGYLAAVWRADVLALIDKGGS
jgi:hypothetical protein